MTLKGRDIVNIGDLELDEIDLILNTAKGMLPLARGEKRSNHTIAPLRIWKLWL